MIEKLKYVFTNKIKSKIAVTLMLSAMYFETYWLFGVMFLLWVLIDIKNKQTHLFEEVRMSENFVLYWVIVLLFAFFAFYYISLFFNETMYYSALK